MFQSTNVICQPQLEEHITIDDDNNVHVIINVTLAEMNHILHSTQNMIIKIGKHEFVIPVNELFIKRQQYYKLKNQGVSHVKTEVYDINDKSDIILNVIMG